MNANLQSIYYLFWKWEQAKKVFIYLQSIVFLIVEAYWYVIIPEYCMI